jgi:triosephosphate isomerase
VKKKIIGANWKMNLSKQESLELFKRYAAAIPNLNPEIELVVFPSQGFLSLLSPVTGIEIGAQNFHAPHTSGAFTGETSLTQLSSLNISWVLVGHSERRMLAHESDEVVLQKTISALELGFKVIFCCGEPGEVRNISSEASISFIKDRLKGIEALTNAQKEKITIAYEPIWAIGTGVTPALDQIDEMTTWIALNTHCTVIYGGSCDENNSIEIFKLPHVSGGLIGNASLNANSFMQIVHHL